MAEERSEDKNRLLWNKWWHVSVRVWKVQECNHIWSLVYTS